MARKRRYSRLSLFYVIVISTLLVGSSVWLDSRGKHAVARVTGKTEEVTVTHDPQGGWYATTVWAPTSTPRARPCPPR